MKVQKYKIYTNDDFAESFAEFQQTATFGRLQQKFKLKPYFQRFKTLRLLAYIASYCFNLVSALTAATVVYFFAWRLSDSLVISTLITAAFTLLLEATKRSVASGLFQNLLQFKKIAIGLSLVVLGLTAISVAFSYNGAKKAVEQFTASPTLVDVVSLTADYKANLERIEEQIKEARNTTWKGKTTTASQRTIKDLTEQKKTIQNQIIKLENESRADNKVAISKHNKRTQLNGNHFALFTLLLELLFLLCAWYLEYYDFRSYAEFAEPTDANNTTSLVPSTSPTVTKKAIPLQNGTHNGAPLQNGSNLARASDYTPITKTIPVIKGEEEQRNVIELAIKKVKNKISTAEYRLRHNIGKRETSEQNKAAAEKELDELHVMLKEL